MSEKISEVPPIKQTRIARYPENTLLARRVDILEREVGRMRLLVDTLIHEQEAFVAAKNSETET